MENVIEKAIRLRNSGVITKFLKKNPKWIQEHPESKGAIIDAFFNSSGKVASYGWNTLSKLNNPIQTDLYRMFDLVRNGILKAEDFQDRITHTEFRTVVIMESFITGWSNPDEILSLFSRQGTVEMLLSLGGFGKSLKKVIARYPGLMESMKTLQNVYELHNL